MLPHPTIHEHGIKAIFEALLEMFQLGSNLKGLSKTKLENDVVHRQSAVCLSRAMALKALLSLWFYHIHLLKLNPRCSIVPTE